MILVTDFYSSLKDDENNTSQAEKTYYRKPEDTSYNTDAAREYISSDVKFIITVVIGLAVIVAIVVFIPRVGVLTFIWTYQTVYIEKAEHSPRGPLSHCLELV